MKLENAGVYVRVKRTQDACKRLDEQMQQALDFAHAQGLSVKWAYDDITSGLQDDRRFGLKRLMADAQAGEIDCLIIRDLSRLFRRCELTEQYLNKLAEYGVAVIIMPGGAG